MTASTPLPPALAGVMHDKAAAKGIIVTTAWFGKAQNCGGAIGMAHAPGNSWFWRAKWAAWRTVGPVT
ncbi:hypothetical protein [Streptomyces sp. NPDC001137]|uniref:hypothetical protein n=1 Tax=Streptomyces sp. NPDC001137 TaxID=3154378 RepID=UPI00331750AD